MGDNINPLRLTFTWPYQTLKMLISLLGYEHLQAMRASYPRVVLKPGG